MGHKQYLHYKNFRRKRDKGIENILKTVLPKNFAQVLGERNGNQAYEA